jgi:hypothetical protein
MPPDTPPSRLGGFAAAAAACVFAAAAAAATECLAIQMLAAVAAHPPTRSGGNSGYQTLQALGLRVQLRRFTSSALWRHSDPISSRAAVYGAYHITQSTGSIARALINGNACGRKSAGYGDALRALKSVATVASGARDGSLG